MNINFEQFQVGREAHQAAAQLIETWSMQSESMLPVTLEQMESYPYSVLGYSDSRLLLGHVAITSCENGQAYAGGLIVNPDFRRQKIGLSFVKYLLATSKEAVPDMRQCLAYARFESSSLFYQAGGVGLGTREPQRNGCHWIIGLTAATKGLIA